MNKKLTLTLLVCLLCLLGACRMKGPEAEKYYGITAEEVFTKMCDAMDPQDAYRSIKSCVITQEISEITKTLSGKEREKRYRLVTKVLMPHCVNVTAYYDGNISRSFYIANDDGYFTRDLSGKVIEVTGESLIPFRFAVQEMLYSGDEQRTLWSSIVLEESDIEPDKYYRLVLSPIVAGVPDRIYYVDRNTFLRKYNVQKTPVGKVKTEIQTYKTFGPHVLVPDLQVTTGSNSSIAPQNIRLLDFQIDTLDPDCCCDFDPYAIQKPSISCPKHYKLPSTPQKP